MASARDNREGAAMENPLFFNYGMNVQPVMQYAKPSAICVTGRGNRYDPLWQTARAQGANVYKYWNPLNIPVGSQDPCDLEQWMGDTTKVPRWRFKGGPIRSNWAGTELADINPGSAWRKYFIQISEDIMRRGLFDGDFVDTLGARPWDANWESWPVDEQKLWTECCVDLARELHEMRARLSTGYDIVHNNLWHLPSSHPAAEKAKEGDRYCNGVCLENVPPDKNTGNRSQFHIDYAARDFAGDPYVRRLLVITNAPKMRDQWKADPNVTHLAFVQSSAGQNYMTATPPVVPYTVEAGSGDNEQIEDDCERQVEELTAKVAELEADNASMRATLDKIHEASAPA